MIADPLDAQLGVLTRALEAALAGSQGWRTLARRALGRTVMVRCSECSSKFESGGRRRFTCSPRCGAVRIQRRQKKCRYCGLPVVECKDTRHAALRENLWNPVRNR
jgi:hypothetical protein